MHNLIQYLDSNRNDILEMISVIEEYMKNAPEGTLSCNRQNGYMRYYHRIKDPKNKKQKSLYISKPETELAEALAVKQYYAKLQPMLVWEEKNISKLLDYYNSNKREEVYESLDDGRKRFIVPFFELPQNIAERWMKEEYPRKELEPEVQYFYTRKKEQVRSKSEKIIADTLAYYEVPYRYECELILDGFSKPIYPDFTVMNKKTGKIMYWEHYGMMDSEDYFNGVAWRMNLYAKNGIFIGDKLIMTFESARVPLNTEIIESYIEHWLL